MIKRSEFKPDISEGTEIKVYIGEENLPCVQGISFLRRFKNNKEELTGTLILLKEESKNFLLSLFYNGEIIGEKVNLKASICKEGKETFFLKERVLFDKQAFGASIDDLCYEYSYTFKSVEENSQKTNHFNKEAYQDLEDFLVEEETNNGYILRYGGVDLTASPCDGCFNLGKGPCNCSLPVNSYWCGLGPLGF